MKLKRRIVIAALVLVPIGWAWAETEPLDLFSDEPQLADGFIRIGSWNLRHINVEGDADHFLEGQTEEEDFEILTKTFAKAIEDLGLDLVAISEHQPRSGEPNRLNQIRDALNGGGQGPWRADASQIVYDDPSRARVEVTSSSPTDASPRPTCARDRSCRCASWRPGATTNKVELKRAAGELENYAVYDGKIVVEP